MSLEQMQPALNALAFLIGKRARISVGVIEPELGAYMLCTGTLGQPEIDRDRVWFPMYPYGGEPNGVSIDASHFEWWGEQGGRVLIVAAGLRILFYAEF
jgi:hypothetical protein